MYYLFISLNSPHKNLIWEQFIYRQPYTALSISEVPSTLTIGGYCQFGNSLKPCPARSQASFILNHLSKNLSLKPSLTAAFKAPRLMSQVRLVSVNPMELWVSQLAGWLAGMKNGDTLAAPSSHSLFKLRCRCWPSWQANSRSQTRCGQVKCAHSLIYIKM